MIKKIIFALGIAAMAIAMAGAIISTIPRGCGENDRFAQLETGERTNVIVDTETGVSYLLHLSGYGCGLTVLVDATGKPLLWQDDAEVRK